MAEDHDIVVATVREKNAAADALQLANALRSIGTAVLSIQDNADGDHGYMVQATVGAFLIAYNDRAEAALEVDSLRETCAAWMTLLGRSDMPSTLAEALGDSDAE